MNGKKETLSKEKSQKRMHTHIFNKPLFNHTSDVDDNVGNK